MHRKHHKSGHSTHIDIENIFEGENLVPEEMEEVKPEDESPLSEEMSKDDSAFTEGTEDFQAEAAESESCSENMVDLEEERLRMFAEMENFKKRLTREKEEQIRYAAEQVLSDLLPTLDNLELALSYGRNNDACKEMLKGLEMTQKLFLDALRAHGLEEVGKVGEEFNPEFHEAMSREQRSDMPPGHIAQLFQTGYRLKGRLLRPAKVVVSVDSTLV